MEDQAHTQRGREGMSSAERKALYAERQMAGTPEGAMLLDVKKTAEAAWRAIQALRGGEGISVNGGVISLENKALGGDGGGSATLSGYTPVVIRVKIPDGASYVLEEITVLKKNVP